MSGMAQRASVCMAFALLTPVLGVTPAQFVRSMGMGINLGNTLDAPHEGAWAAPAQEKYFDAYVAAGFESVRVPCRWDEHVSKSAPYILPNNTFLSRVFEVAGWAVARNLPTIVNTHHDDWLDGSANNTDFAHNLERLVAIWDAIAERFQHVPDRLLAFEIYNEPHENMTTGWLNQMNAAVLPAIRRTNPTRNVFLGGLHYMNPTWILSNPDAIRMLSPQPADPHLALTVHSYAPFSFCSGDSKTGPTTTSWPPDAIESWAAPLRAWADAHQVAIYLGEFGCKTSQTNTTGRLAWYRAVREATEAHGFAATVWDDSGQFAIFDRAAGTWDEDVLVALGKLNASEPAMVEQH